MDNDESTRDQLAMISVGGMFLGGGGLVILVGAVADKLGAMGVLVQPAMVQIPMAGGWGLDLPRLLVLATVVLGALVLIVAAARKNRRRREA